MKSVERDWKVRRLTTHTPQFLGLPTGVWPTGGGFDRAGEDIVIGFVDSGIFPHHPSFATHHVEPYGPIPKYRGKCEVDPDTKRNFCNGKIVGAQHFAEAAIAAGSFNPSIDFASPLDGDGHGRLDLYTFSYPFHWESCENDYVLVMLSMEKHVVWNVRELYQLAKNK